MFYLTLVFVYPETGPTYKTKICPVQYKSQKSLDDAIVSNFTQEIQKFTKQCLVGVDPEFVYVREWYSCGDTSRYPIEDLLII